MHPTLILGSYLGPLSRKWDTDICSFFAELRGIRLEFESTQMNGIWGTGYCTREGLSISLHGGSMKGDMNWISAEWYCEKPTTKLWLQAESSMEEGPEVVPIKDNGFLAQKIGETLLRHFRHLLEMSERLTS